MSKDLTKDVLDAKVQQALDEAQWSWLREHANRSAIILVAPELDLVEVGRAIARDDTAQVTGWLQTGRLTKPTQAQLAGWDETPSLRFLTIILQPYVLVQPKRSELH